MTDMTEAIYLDVDGTLRDERNGIPKSAKWALAQCKKKGIKIFVCTGRGPDSIQNDVYTLPLDGIISGGGCYAEYQGRCLWKRHFSRELTEIVTEQADLKNIGLALETEKTIYMNEDIVRFYKKDLEKKLRGTNVWKKKRFFTKNKIRYKDNLKEFYESKPPIHKICMIGKKTDVDKIKRAVKSESEIVQEKFWNNCWYLELLPKGCDKGKAVREINRRLKIDSANTISFGDSENDIAMMKETGTAVAVGNNSFIVQKYAKSVAEPVMKDGIYKELVRRKVIQPNVRRRKGNEKTMVAGRSCLSDLSEKFLRQ